MTLPTDRAGWLAVGTGGAGAATMLMLVLADLTGAGSPAARVGALAFALMLTLPLAVVLHGLLRPAAGASRTVRGAITLGVMLWLAGLGADLFSTPGGQGPLLLVSHSLALVGGLALLGGGLVAARPPLTRAQRRARGPRA